MATAVIPTKCSEGHLLWIRNSRDYFCKICGDIDIEELKILTENEIRRRHDIDDLEEEYKRLEPTDVPIEGIKFEGVV